MSKAIGEKLVGILCVVAAVCLLMVVVDATGPWGYRERDSHPHPEGVNINEVIKAFIMEAHVRGDGTFPEHVSQLIPQRLSARRLGLNDVPAPTLRPWPGEDVYSYGKYYFVRVPDRNFDDTPYMVLLFGDVSIDDGRFVGFVDGHVELVRDREMPERLERTRTIIRRRDGEATTVN